MDNRYLKNIKKGMKVEILNSRNKKCIGFIEDIAVRTDFHEEGIMVRLNNGEIGRVKKIILNDEEKNKINYMEIKKIIENGEDFYTEFKSEILWSTNYNPIQIKEAKSYELKEYGQRASKVIIAKAIASFLNSDGGNLIIGVKENKEENKFEIVGIEEDLKKVKKQNKDEYRRVFIDEVIKPFFPPKIFNNLNNYLSMEFVDFDNKTLFWIKVKRTESRVFLNLNGKDIFMIRVDSENRTLEGEKLVDYCIRKWGAK